MSELYDDMGVPTTRSILKAYVWVGMDAVSDDWEAARTADFHAWLAGVRAEARREGQAEAWQEGNFAPLAGDNPYETEEETDVDQ